MQSLYDSTRSYVCHTGNVVDLEEYRRKLAQEQAGLPPLPRREHRCPLGLRPCDLVSMALAAGTVALTVALLGAL